MGTIIDAVSDFQNRSLDGLNKGQEVVLDINKTVAEALTNYMPDSIPGVPEGLKVPDFSGLVSDVFDYAGKVVASNGTFVREVVSVWSDVVQDLLPAKPAPKAAAKSTEKKAS